MKYFYQNNQLTITKPFEIIYCENLDFYAHWHPEVEFVYILEGCSLVGVNNNKRLLEKGDMVILGSGDIHYFQSSHHTSKILVIQLKPEIVDNSHSWPDDIKFSSPYIYSEIVTAQHLEELKHIIYQIMDEEKNKSDSYELFIKSHLLELCATVSRYLPKCKTQNKYMAHPKLCHIQEILAFIEENYAKDVSMSFLSNRFRISLFHLSRLLNQFTGTNFKSYLNTLRVNAAENLIINTDAAITEIALKCGFESLRTFNRVYRQIKGHIPSYYRKTYSLPKE